METTSSSSSTIVESILFGIFATCALVLLVLMLHSCHTYMVHTAVHNAVDARFAEIDERNAHREAELAAAEASSTIQSEPEAENH